MTGGDLERHYEKAKKNNPESQYVLYTVYMQGEMLQVDIAAAMGWLKLAAVQGYSKAIEEHRKIKEASEQGNSLAILQIQTYDNSASRIEDMVFAEESQAVEQTKHVESESKEGFSYEKLFFTLIAVVLATYFLYSYFLDPKSSSASPVNVYSTSHRDYNGVMVEVKVNKLTIKDVILNRGNCKAFQYDGTPYPSRYPGYGTKEISAETFSFGERRAYYGVSCNVIEATVVTDKGSYSFSFDKK